MRPRPNSRPKRLPPKRSPLQRQSPLPLPGSRAPAGRATAPPRELRALPSGPLIALQGRQGGQGPPIRRPQMCIRDRYAPYAGAKYHEGTLLAFEGGEIVLGTKKGELRIPFDKTSKVCLLIEV